MARQIKEQFEKILSDLRQGNDEIQGAALFTPDGMMLAQNLSTDNKPEEVTNISASLLAFGQKSTAILKNGIFEELHMEGEKNATLVYDAGKSILTIIIKPKANLGMIHLDANVTVQSLKEVFA